MAMDPISDVEVMAAERSVQSGKKAKTTVNI